MAGSGDCADPDDTCRVTAAYGRRVEIQTPNGHRHPARVRGRKLRLVCNDRVAAEALPGEEDWLVTARLARKSELARTDSRGQREVLAANIDVMIVVVAPRPSPDLFVVDRFVAAARLNGMDAAIVINKADLDTDTAGLCACYETLGLNVVIASARTGSGTTELAGLLESRVGVLVGQSGVGKSSLVNRLVPAARLETAALGMGGDEGRHTTVAARLVQLPTGGELIDSPGVRDFAPHIEDLRDVAHGFAEIDTRAAACRFNDCRHVAEPGCAVTAAVSAGEIDCRRYKSYRRLLTLSEQLAR
ncbi:MAG: ribosome small subunit-dependent GTPase A [Pseudomonadota bacterium]